MYNSENNRSSERIWNAAIYVRLSKEDEGSVESVSIESQIAIIDNFIKENDDIRKYKIFKDDGYSGGTFDKRPAIDCMFLELKEKKYDCLIVKDLSRFSRNLGESLNYFIDTVNTNKIRFISITDNIDSYKLPGSTSSLLTKIKLLLNEHYIAELSRKCKCALDARRKMGLFIGSQAAFGYRKDPNNHSKLIIDDYSATIIKFIFNNYIAGNSMRQIAQILNQQGCLTPSRYKLSIGIDDGRAYLYNKTYWDSTTVRRILENRMYVGDMVQGKMQSCDYHTKKLISTRKEDYIIVENTHDAIISKGVFENAQLLMKRDTRISTSSGEIDLFSGFLKCGDCKRAMNKKLINNGYKKYTYYICSTFKKLGSDICSKHTIKYETLYNNVFETIRKTIDVCANIGEIIDYINKNKNRTRVSDKLQNGLDKKYIELAKTKEKELSVYEDYKNDIINQDVFFAYKKKIGDKIEQINKEIESDKEMIEQLKNGFNKENQFIESFVQYGNIKELNRNVLTELIENIYIYEDDRIEIVFRFKDAFKHALEYISLNSHIIGEQKKLLLSSYGG